MPFAVYASPGSGLRVMVISAGVLPAANGRLEADGVVLIRANGVPCSQAGAPVAPADHAVRVGAVYGDAATGLTVRCVSGSARQLSLDGRPLRRVR
jgi:hypothetical protein